MGADSTPETMGPITMAVSAEGTILNSMLLPERFHFECCEGGGRQFECFCQWSRMICCQLNGRTMHPVIFIDFPYSKTPCHKGLPHSGGGGCSSSRAGSGICLGIFMPPSLADSEQGMFMEAVVGRLEFADRLSNQDAGNVVQRGSASTFLCLPTMESMSKGLKMRYSTCGGS